MKRLDIALLLGIIISVGLASFSAFAGEYEAIRENMVRLHVLANSDSEEDQALKLLVRDALLRETAELFGGEDKQTAERRAAGQLGEIERIAREAIAGQGYDYTVKAELVNMYFGTRYYDETIVAAGWYDAVRITIGEGGGKNWWCVMFPPMCLPAASPGEAAGLQQAIQTAGAPVYQPKFALIELLEKAQNKLNGRTEQPLAPGA